MYSTRLARRLDAVVLGRWCRAVAEGCAAFGALVLPSCCVVCGAWDTSLCPGCVGSFRSATARPFRAEEAAESLPDVAMRSAHGSDRGSDHGDIRGAGASGRDGPAPFAPLPVVAGGRYGREVSAVMLAFKNHGHVDIAAPVAAALCGALHQAVTGGLLGPTPGGRVMLVPVPSRAAARRRRGYDPLMLLLVRLDRSGLLPAGVVLAPWIRHIPLPVRVAADFRRGGARVAARTVRDAVVQRVSGGQKGADHHRRRSNVMRSMTLSERGRRAVAGRQCVIVDDVLTTGATIGEAHRTLAAAGGTVLGAVVVAATGSPYGNTGTRTDDIRGPLPTAAWTGGSDGGGTFTTPHEGAHEPCAFPERQGMNKTGP